MWTKGGASRGNPSTEVGGAEAVGAWTDVASRALPMPVRERRPALAALAILLILGGALATTAIVMRADKRVSAIIITKQIGAGRPFDPGAMREARVVEDGVTYELWAHHAQVSHTVAAVTLLPGTLVTTDMTVEWNKELVPGKARVGLALKPGQIPGEMKAGQRVQIVLVPAGGGGAVGQEGRLLAESALVDSVGLSRNRAEDEVTVIVDSNIAPAIATYASSGQIAITELPGAR
jgi:hypothetical protein